MSCLRVHPDHYGVLRYHSFGPNSQPFFLRLVQRGRQPAVCLEHLTGQHFWLARHAGGDKLRPALGPGGPASPGSAVLPHTALL